MAIKLKPSSLKIKTQKVGPQSEDIKDREIYAAPPTHHNIKCRYCNEEKRVLTKYSRSCDSCRNSSWFRSHHTTNPWQAWGDTIG